MSEYIPDTWVVLEIKNKGNVMHKVFAGWYGGFGGSDSWKLNSGIVRVEKDGQCYLFHGSSGSVYRCPEGAYRMSAYQHSVLDSFQYQAAQVDDVSITVMPEETNFLEIDYK